MKRLVKVSLALVVYSLLGEWVVADSSCERVWTDVEGRRLVAELISADEVEVVLKLESGREARVALDRLSDEDLQYVSGLKKTGETLILEPLPDETAAPRQIEVSGGPRVFRTPHFEFRTDQDVSKAFIAEAARVYEGTYHALEGIPHGLQLRPPSDREYYRGEFMGERPFAAAVAEVMPSLPGQRVVGLYVPGDQKLMVPYSSLGAKMLGSKLTLRKSSDATTLIHEIVHQLMHDWLPLVPIWFVEGVSEYVAAVPYQNGRFEYRNSERGLKERLQLQYGMERGDVRGVRRPSEIMGLERFQSISSGKPVESGPVLAGVALDVWGGTVREYRDAMLLIYYFMHLDRPDKPGAPVGAYMRLVDRAKGQIVRLETEVKTFEQDRLSYNEQVNAFNQALDQFRTELKQYNDRVQQYNEQVREGIAEEERVSVGEAPQAPVPPEELVLPESIKNSLMGGTIDLIGLVQRDSLPALIRGRSADELDEGMRAAFQEIGLQVSFSN